MTPEFVPVLTADELQPGTPTAVDVAGEPVCLVRVDEGVFAFDDRCPHRGTPLSLGSLDGTTLTCSAHTWEFDVTTGALLRIRAPDCLTMRPVRERDGTIEVGASAARPRSSVGREVRDGRGEFPRGDVGQRDGLEHRAQ